MNFNIKAIANKRTTTQRLEAMSFASSYLGCAAIISLSEPLVQGGRKRCNPFIFSQKLQHPLFQMGNNSTKIMGIKLRQTDINNTWSVLKKCFCLCFMTLPIKSTCTQQEIQAVSVFVIMLISWLFLSCTITTKFSGQISARKPTHIETQVKLHVLKKN